MIDMINFCGLMVVQDLLANHIATKHYERPIGLPNDNCAAYGHYNNICN